MSAPQSEHLGEFARLTLDGEGIRPARVPTAHLAEFLRYKALIVEAASVAWRDDHPDDELPDDFASSFELDLPPFEDGSAVAVFERTVTGPYEDYFTNGRDTVQLGLEAIAFDAVPPTDLDFLGTLAFRDFGSSLSEHQVLRLGPTPGAQAGVNITREVWSERIRPTYEKAQREANTRVTRTGAVAGRLVMLDAEKRRFTLRTLLFGQVNGRYQDPERTADLRSVLNSSAQAPVVRLEGRLRFNGDKLERILDVGEVELLEIDGQPWSRRVIELASLPAGWSDGIGEPISFAAIDAARELLRRLTEAGVRHPGIYPMEDGGVQLEWGTPQRVTSVEVDADVHLTAFSIHVPTKQPQELETEDLAQAYDFLAEALQ